MAFELSKQGIEDATKYLKETKDSFYKSKTAWEVLSKADTIKPSMMDILDTANKLKSS